MASGPARVGNEVINSVPFSAVQSDAIGTKRTNEPPLSLSAVEGIADMAKASRHVA